MERREALARLLVTFILVILPVTFVGYRYGVRAQLAPEDTIHIHAASPERGGFSPGAIQIEAGQSVTLRFTSEDVTHGIAIGPGLDIDLGEVEPGKTKEVTLTFEESGTYTYYCNTWCSPDHWRMRGVIDVRDPQKVVPDVEQDPIIQALSDEGVDIDASLHRFENDADPPTLHSAPSTARGRLLVGDVNVAPELLDTEWRMRHTPFEALSLLVAANPGRTQNDLVDVTAYLWSLSLQSLSSQYAADLYNKNCAACHGQDGGGDGFAAATLVNSPSAFADPEYMFAMRRDVLYAKIRRGGMGTGMPNFGTLFTPQETWALVDYLWTFILRDETDSTQSGRESRPYFNPPLCPNDFDSKQIWGSSVLGCQTGWSLLFGAH